MDFTQFDRDELRGQEWMRSLTLPEHAAIPSAVNPAGTLFRARCGCGWMGELRSAHGVGPVAKERAWVDADKHNAEWQGSPNDSTRL
jgi:hypothetical protein